MNQHHTKSTVPNGAHPVLTTGARLVRGALRGLLAVSLTATTSAVLTLPLAVTAQAAPDAQYNARFLTQYQKIKNPANGYFSADGVPYHSPETLIVEAPDYGHETTSEAYSFWLWLEAQYGRATGDWRPLNAAWANMEKFMIPSQADQPSNNFYNPGKPATYAAEYKLPSNYPAPLATGVPVGVDPIANELQATYGTSTIYGMHWLLDVDNWYGYGRCGDGVTKPSYINTFQRGPQESVWETVPHPSCETFRWGRNGGSQGFLSLFVGDSNYARQWRYTNAPDADARAVQAIYWASVWAKEQGKSADVAELVKKAAKMGDYLRYAMFDKYFKKIGNCVDKYGCPAGSGAANAQGYRDNQHYLMSWYYAWGGATDPGSGWAWRIGSSHNHFGYQNPMAAWVLSSLADFKPASPSAAGDWGKSLTRQMELYRWLQSADGAIAGGATNSYGGDYLAPPAGTATFYGMYYDEKPVYHDPASNTWFGFQAWSMQRVAEFYYATGNAKAKALLDKWVNWALANTSLLSDGSYAIPNTLAWSGQPDNWNAAAPGANAGLRVTVVDKTADVGVAAAYARTLIYYAAKSNHAAAKTMAKQLLDRMWTKHQDPMGLAVDETRTDYKRFTQPYDPSTGSGVYIPNGWTGTNGQGATIDSNATFLSMRPKYMQDPKWPVLKAYLDGGAAPKWRYHRFWAQADIAMAMSDYANLIGGTVTPAVIASPGSVAVPEARSVNVGVKLSAAPAANVTVAVAKLSGGDADLKATGALVFTPANYNVAQNVTISAAADADQVNGQASFRLTATGHTAATVTATEVDDDVVVAPKLVVSGAPLSVPEGAARSFQVRLAAAPSANLTVSTVRASGDADLAVAGGGALSFTPANWNLNQNVTVAAAVDADSVNGAASFTVSAPGAAPVSVAATEVDKDVVVATGCRVEFDASNDWGGGQVASVTLYNTTSTPIVGWSLSWTESNDVTLANAWNATVSVNGRSLVATPVSYNGTVPANGSVNFGMQLGYSGAKPVPTGLKWAGRNCSIVVK